MKIPEKFGIWGNADKPEFWSLLPEILKWGRQNGLEVYLTTRIKNLMKDEYGESFKIIESADDFNKLDFVLTLGGDGTILSAVRAIGFRKTPILGVHLGELGFLAKVTLRDVFNRLDNVASGEYLIESRLVLHGAVHQDDKINNYTVLNDFVVNNGNSHRMLTCQLFSGKKLVGNYKADGIIIATPTGSTAYSLSAGGPIVSPEVNSIIVTPICPHSLTSRPIILPDTSQLEVRLGSESFDDAAVSIDGQIVNHLEVSSRILVKKADYSASFIGFSNMSYFNNLRTKMGWGERRVRSK